MTEPYYSDDTVTLYLGDMRELLPTLGVRADCAIADPPYGTTSLKWDRWQTGWLAAVAQVTDSMWCFGQLAMFMSHADEFKGAGWKLSHDTVGEHDIDTTVWEKHNGAGMHNDRFRRVHELVGHFYRGPWAAVYREPQREPMPATTHNRAGLVISSKKPDTHGGSASAVGWSTDGSRLVRSVIRAASMWRRGAIHPTQKPVDLLIPHLVYACPPGGLVVDPAAGSCSTGIAARLTGRRALLFEAAPDMCAKAAERLARQATGEAAPVLDDQRPQPQAISLFDLGGGPNGA